MTVSTRALHPILLTIALAVACLGASVARGDLPGTIPLSAAGAGHFWWVVRSEPTLDQGGAPVGASSGARGSGAPGSGAPGSGTPNSGVPSALTPTWALMHHATVEPAPSERLVMRFPSEPVALAAEGDRVAVVTRAEQGGGFFVLSMFAARNEAVGHWFTLPRGAPIVLPAPPVVGEVRGAAIAGDRLGLLVRVRRERPSDPERNWFGTLACESGSGSSWREEPLPPVDLAEQVRLFARAGAFAVLGASVDGRNALLAEHAVDGWRSDAIGRAGGAPLPARAVMGGFELGGRTVLAVRDGGLVQLGFVRERALQQWAEFREPERSWTVGPFGERALLLEIGPRARGFARVFGFSDRAPGESVDLSPPGFASGNWIHLPILGILSVALVLAAVIFGADAYLESSRGGVRANRTARGAALSRRATALFIDMLPGLVGVWFVVRGTPFDLVRIPAFQPDLSACVPALVVFGAGWLVASVGDVVFGRSMGKRVVGLRIISVAGGTAPVGRRLLRALASTVPVMSPLVMLIALLNPRGDGPAEMLTRTAVVDESEPDAQAIRTPESGSGSRGGDGRGDEGGGGNGAG